MIPTDDEPPERPDPDDSPDGTHTPASPPQADVDPAPDGDQSPLPTEKSVSGGGDDTYPIRNDESITIGLVTAVASALDCDPMEIDPLYETVDPDALESLFTSRRSGGERVGTLTFPFNDCLVTLVDGDRVVVEPFEVAD